MRLPKFFERRSVAQPSRQLLEMFSAGSTAAGISVSPELAVTVPAVFACLQVISQDVARTPIKFRQRTGEDSYVDARDHDLWEILSSLPNPEQTAYQFKHAMQWQLLTYGRAYAEIVRVDGRVQALWPLDARHMRVDRDEQRRKRWSFTADAGKVTTWTFEASQPPILELVHETPLNRCRELVGMALALQRYTGRFFANSARPAGALLVPGQLKPEQRSNLRASWAATFGSTDNAHKVAVLDGDMKFAAFASENDKAQLNETTQAITQQICGVFRVPTFKVGDLTKATYSNVAAGELSYVSSTLDPFFQCWEDAIRRDLLTSRQYNRYSATFDRNALIRSDVQAHHTALATGIQAGFYSQNDARKALGQNPIPDGDTYMLNSALVPVADKERPTNAEDNEPRGGAAATVR